MTETNFQLGSSAPGTRRRRTKTRRRSRRRKRRRRKKERGKGEKEEDDSCKYQSSKSMFVWSCTKDAR